MIEDGDEGPQKLKMIEDNESSHERCSSRDQVEFWGSLVVTPHLRPAYHEGN